MPEILARRLYIYVSFSSTLHSIPLQVFFFFSFFFFLLLDSFSMAPTVQISVSQKGNGNYRKEEVKEVECNRRLVSNRLSIRGVLSDLQKCGNEKKEMVSLALGDASSHECFKEGKKGVSDALASAVSLADHDCYAPSYGFGFARRAVADYLSKDVIQKLKESDVFLTNGATQSIHVFLTVVATPGCNILLPLPGFPLYESVCDILGIQIRYYDLLPSNDWEVDLDQVRMLADEKTVGMVVINPSNPCGAVYSYQHLFEIAKTAGSLNFPIIADEVYAHMVYNGCSFVPMLSFTHLAPIIIIGSLSKRWMVPGWRLGWLAISDSRGSLNQIRNGIESLMNVTAGPASVIQAAVPSIVSDSHEKFHKNVNAVLESAAATLCRKINNIDGLKCYSKPNGSMFAMVKVNTGHLHGIKSDMDFAKELMKEESVVVLPGTVLGLKNWVRLFFGVPENRLSDACDRIKVFCQRRWSVNVVS